MIRRSAMTVTFDAFHAVATSDAFIIITRRRGVITLPFCSAILIIGFGIDAFAVAEDLIADASRDASPIGAKWAEIVTSRAAIVVARYIGIGACAFCAAITRIVFGIDIFAIAKDF